jgi:hypothetical protein
MKRASMVATFAAVFFANLVAGTVVSADEIAATAPPPDLAFQAQQFFSESQYAKLEDLIDKLVDSKERAVDGRYQLYMLTSGLGDWFGLWDERLDSTHSTQFREWRQQFPDSAAEPIVEAMFTQALAWRARGTGYASEVASEAWTLFRKRNEQALRILMDNRKRSSTLPTWYELVLALGEDTGMPGKELSALFEEGIHRFPGYHSIYFAYARQFSPRWGGSYERADAFIREVVAIKTNPDGEALYARLYWLLDQESGAPQTFFNESLVSWPRMRNGFEVLMKQFPLSQWNLANFAMFACRAHDGNTYLKLRPTVDPAQARLAGQGTFSLEVCDARFLKETDNRPGPPSTRLARHPGQAGVLRLERPVRASAPLPSAASPVPAG